MAEFRDAIKKIKKEEEEKLNLTILPGVHRSGTSVLFQCLYNTDGFKERRTLRMLGSPETEHRLWRVANHMVTKYLGAECFLEGTPRDYHMADFFIGRCDYNKYINEDTEEEMDDLIRVLLWQDIKLLKEPNCQFALPVWINRYKCFKNAKYIWTRRNVRQTAKSLVRLKVPNRLDARGIEGPTGYRKYLKVKTAENMTRMWEKSLAKTMPQVNHIVIWHHDLINKPEETFKRISEFVGAEVNTEPFDLKKVYGKT